MEKSDYKKLGLPAVRVVDVKGYEFAKVGTIAKWLDVSADVVRDDKGAAFSLIACKLFPLEHSSNNGHLGGLFAPHSIGSRELAEPER